MYLSVLAPQHIFPSLAEESHRVSREQIDSPLAALPKVHCLVRHLEEEVHTCIVHCREPACCCTWSSICRSSPYRLLPGNKRLKILKAGTVFVLRSICPDKSFSLHGPGRRSGGGWTAVDETLIRRDLDQPSSVHLQVQLTDWQSYVLLFWLQVFQRFDHPLPICCHDWNRDEQKELFNTL